MSVELQTAIAYFHRGQRLKAKLLKLDKENQKLAFGLKQLFLNTAEDLKPRASKEREGALSVFHAM